MGQGMWPMHLRLLSKCKRYILNASRMLQTSGCTRYTLKVTFWLHRRTVLLQSRSCCMVNQPTCVTIEVPITIVLLAFINHHTQNTGL